MGRRVLLVGLFLLLHVRFKFPDIIFDHETRHNFPFHRSDFDLRRYAKFQGRIRYPHTVMTRSRPQPGNSGDIEGFIRGYWNSEKLAFISGNTVSRGWQATLDTTI